MIEPSFERSEESETHRPRAAEFILHRNLNQQAEPLLLAVGATDAELTRHRHLMTDPEFRAWFYQFLVTSGRRP